MVLNGFQKTQTFNRKVFAPTLPGLLDIVKNAYVAYGLKKLRAAYAGQCFKARHSSGTEQDIGFDPNGNMDTAALMTFASGGTVYLKTWYDQSGNGKDLTITTFDATKSYAIVSSGVLNTDQFGNPMFRGNGTGQGSVSSNLPQHITGHPTGDHSVLSYVQFTESFPFGILYGNSVERLEISSSATRGSRLFKTGGGMATVGSAIVMSNQPQYIQTTTNLTSLKTNWYQNGQGVKQNASITTYTPDAVLRLGYSNTAFTFRFDDLMGELVLYSRVLTDTEMRNAWRCARQKFSLPAPVYIIGDGDSLTEGDSTTLKSYFRQLNLILNPNVFYQHYDSGVGGDRIIEMISEATTADTGIDFIKYLEPNPYRLLIAWGGTNQIVQVPETPATTYASTLTYVSGRKATGNFNRIAWLTSLPRENTTITTEMFQYNDLLRSGMLSGGTLAPAGCDALVDINTLAQFDADGDYNDLTYFGADKIHLVDAGQAIIASYLKQALNLA